MNLYKFIALFISSYLIDDWTAEGWLHYQGNSLLQITIGFSGPVDLPNEMRMLLNWCLQANYMLPSSAADFTTIPQWTDFSRRHQERAIDYDKYLASGPTHFTDATAGVVYIELEALMISYGYHETCLLKSVCEVAKHPFNLTDENLLAEIINYVLSPSLHKAFGENEIAYQSAYEAAEKYGASDLDCDFAYPDCEDAFINIITRVEFD